MKYPDKYAIFVVLLFYLISISGQSPDDIDSFGKETLLFQSEKVLPVTLKFSFKELRSNTNDSTYSNYKMGYMNDGVWDSIDVQMRIRGNYRKKTCHFPPLKIKIEDSSKAHTLFEDDKKLKVVLPCLVEKDCNDNVVKEYMAYKLFEQVSPYHFDARLLDIDLVNQRKRKPKSYKVKGIFIEDVDKLEDRYKIKEQKRKMHPLAQDNLSAVRNDLFQFMIGNTDFSTAYRHNEKLFFRAGKTIPVPYDFDMCGLVNPSYGVVSQVAGVELPIDKVTDRYFRGFKRDQSIYQEVRRMFLAKRKDLMKTVAELEPLFENHNEYENAYQYIESFFTIIESDKKFEEQVLRRARKM